MLKYLMFLSLFAVLFIPQVFGIDTNEDKDSTGFLQKGTVMQIHFALANTNDHLSSTSILFKFTNIDGTNYWDDRQQSEMTDAHTDFVAHEDYFLQKVGRFYIDPIYDLDGVITQKSFHNEIIVFDQLSKAAQDGCDPDHKMVLRPDYSVMVCVFADSVEKFSQRGWITD